MPKPSDDALREILDDEIVSWGDGNEECVIFRDDALRAMRRAVRGAICTVFGWTDDDRSALVQEFADDPSAAHLYFTETITQQRAEAVERERERCARVAEARRQQILANPDDPSWTEHFAEVEAAIRAGEVDDGEGE